jgi:hypothetical protein
MPIISPITLLSVKGAALSPAEADGNIEELDVRTAEGWSDLISPLSPVGVPAGFVPEYLPFGPSGLRREMAFAVGDYAYSRPMHVNHDVKPGGRAVCHVHWSSNGTSLEPVRWEFQISRALGHNQAYFTAETSYFVQQSSNGGAWRHMVAEMDLADALILTEPDELILVTLRRVANGGTENTDDVFGLLVDFHYESDRRTTPNKSPNFYA